MMLCRVNIFSVLALSIESLLWEHSKDARRRRANSLATTTRPHSTLPICSHVQAMGAANLLDEAVPSYPNPSAATTTSHLRTHPTRPRHHPLFLLSPIWKSNRRALATARHMSYGIRQDACHWPTARQRRVWAGERVRAPPLRLKSFCRRMHETEVYVRLDTGMLM